MRWFLFLCVWIISGKGVSKYAIRIHTSIADPNFFKWSRFAPDRNNVRPNFLNPETRHQSDSQNLPDQSIPGPPTPHYNAALLSELGAMERHLKELYNMTQECPSVIDAVMLSKIWIKQRGLEKVREEGREKKRKSVYVCVWERERGREGGREGGREREREGGRERGRERGERERERERERE